jgi:predicted tellurium resistance membrane protein TerC
VWGLGANIYDMQVDSIPAVFGVTRDSLIILSLNIFAIRGNYSDCFLFFSYRIKILAFENLKD